MPALAITDHGSMYGAIEFYEKAKEAGVKPIIGVEVYVVENHLDKTPNSKNKDDRYHHLVLLAKNEKGYRNLLKITSTAYLDGFYYKPRVDKKILEGRGDGIIALSACMAGEIPSSLALGRKERALKAVEDFQSIFGKENFFLELQPHKEQEEVNNKLKELSVLTGAPLVITNDIHYVRADDKDVQDILICVQSGHKVSDEKRMSLKNFDLHFKTSEEMRSSFLDVPEAADNTLKIAEMCNLELDMGELLLPKFETPSGKSPDEYLLDLCHKGVEKRFGKKIEEAGTEVQERLNYEFGVIKRMGFSSYFLIVQDFVNWAKNQGIVVGPGRGSAAGSLVSYVLGITELDPLKYNLLFERFLNPDRISMPDIDIDFADDRREEVIEYVAAKYGRQKVSQIITFGTMAARAAIRDVGRVLGYPYELCDRVAKMVPMMMDFEKTMKTARDLIDLYERDPMIKKLIDYARRLEGVARHSSRHACGVVIGPEDLNNYTPLQFASNEDKTVISQYGMKIIEKIGLLKMDFLGLKNLTLIQNTIRIIKARHGIEIDLSKIDPFDEKAFALFQRGETTGFFQFESAGMRRYLKKLHPEQFEDLIAMAALYRPGPLNSGMVDEFIMRKHGKKIVYNHPTMEKALQNTYGVIVYQEQVMQLSRDMAGFTGGEADTLRKGMGKKIPELIAKLREDFIKGCIKNGISKKIAEQTFSDMEKFAEYGFNRSHAACYAMIGYQTAYLKGNYPAEFMAALLTADQNDIDRISIEVEECRQIGLDVLAPDVNKSFGNFGVINEEGKDQIRFGLRAIKNVGENIVKVIVEERKNDGEYKNISDFMKRIKDKDLNKKSLESLIRSGAMDSLGERGELLFNLERLLMFHKEQIKNQNSSQFGLFGVEEQSITILPAEKVPDAQRLSWEKELLGLFISGHPLKEYKEKFEEYVTLIPSLTLKDEKKNVRLVGVIGIMKQIYTKKNELMAFVEIEDLGGKVEVIVFPRVFERTREFWVSGGKIVVEGKVSTKDESVKILADEVHRIEEFENKIDSGRAEKSYVPIKSEGNGDKQYFYRRKENKEETFVSEKIDYILPEKKENENTKILHSGKVFLSLDESLRLEVLVPRLNLILGESKKGETAVFLRIQEKNGREKELKTSFSIEFTKFLLQKIKNLLGEERVKWEE